MVPAWHRKPDRQKVVAWTLALMTVVPLVAGHAAIDRIDPGRRRRVQGSTLLDVLPDLRASYTTPRLRHPCKSCLIAWPARPANARILACLAQAAFRSPTAI